MRLRTGLVPAWIDGLEEGVRYKIRPLTGAQRLTMSQALWQAGNSTAVDATIQVDAVKAALLEWDGVYDADGAPLRLDQDTIELLGDAELASLFARVYELSVLNTSPDPAEDDAGNSESQSK